MECACNLALPLGIVERRPQARSNHQSSRTLRRGSVGAQGRSGS